MRRFLMKTALIILSILLLVTLVVQLPSVSESALATQVRDSFFNTDERTVPNHTSREPGGTTDPMEPDQSYRVRRGDTLLSISREFSVPAYLIAEENDLLDWGDLVEGQALIIPSPIEGEELEFKSAYELAGMFDFFFRKGSGDTNRIALTFDDGPDDTYTPQVLQILEEHRVPATFFLMGSRAERYPEAVREMVSDGHIIANHSWSHPDLRTLTEERVHSEITRTEEILHQITGLQTAMMRPPFGAISEMNLVQLRGMGYHVINWSVDSRDWETEDVDQILRNTLPDVEEEAILLFHSAGGEGQSMAATVEVLPELIETLTEQGYVFVTVNELLAIPAYK